jgi:hypothetical protein
MPLGAVISFLSGKKVAFEFLSFSVHRDLSGSWITLSEVGRHPEEPNFKPLHERKTMKIITRRTIVSPQPNRLRVQFNSSHNLMTTMKISTLDKSSWLLAALFGAFAGLAYPQKSLVADTQVTCTAPGVLVWAKGAGPTPAAPVIHCGGRQ